MFKLNAKEFLDRRHRNVMSIISPFYRAYPYSGHLPFPRADARGAISQDDQFFYNRVPKVANSTIITTLAELSVDINNQTMKGDPKNYFLRPSKVKYNIASNIQSNYFKFTFVRNPYSRTLSAYLDKIVKGNNKIWDRWAKLHDTETVPSFVEFCRYLQRTGRYDDAHWAPQVDCMLIPIKDFDMIGRFEFLERDIKILLTQIFPKNIGNIKVAGPPATRANSKLKQYYNDECIDIVKDIYSSDFELFNYEKDFTAALD